METAIYYRDNELISVDDLILMRKVWGDTPYNWVREYVIDDNSGSGLHLITEIVLVIQTTEKLYNRSESLKERIAKGLTYSKGYNGGYVEENLLYKLMMDAIAELEATTDIKVKTYDYPFNEFKRLYNIPYKSVMDEVRECIEKIGDIPEPKKNIEFERKFNKEPVCDQCSTYQLNYVKVKSAPFKLMFGDEALQRIYKLFPFLGKLYYDCSGDYYQIYLYDYHNNTKGLQVILNYLEENGVVFN